MLFVEVLAAGIHCGKLDLAEVAKWSLWVVGLMLERWTALECRARRRQGVLHPWGWQLRRERSARQI